ncbi:MAG: nuclear transport factor 2 family protein [Thermoanaerobaculia bacterium]
MTRVRVESFTISLDGYGAGPNQSLENPLGFAPFDHVHHQVGNFRTTVNSTQAQVKCYGVAFHYRSAAAGIKSRVFVGTYEFALVATGASWKISHFVFTLKFIEGNLQLEQPA